MDGRQRQRGLSLLDLVTPSHGESASLIGVRNAQQFALLALDSTRPSVFLTNGVMGEFV